MGLSHEGILSLNEDALCAFLGLQEEEARKAKEEEARINSIKDSARYG